VVKIALAAAVAIPAPVLRLLGVQLAPVPAIAVFGSAVVVRIGFAIAYAALALSLLIWRRRELPRIARYASCSSSASTGSKLS
jgi:hypothetical protein